MGALPRIVFVNQPDYLTLNEYLTILVVVMSHCKQ